MDKQHLQPGVGAVQSFFHHLVSTVKKYFLKLQLLFFFNLFSYLELWIFTPTHSITYVYAKQSITFYAKLIVLNMVGS